MARDAVGKDRMYRELTMTDVREVLRRWQAEQSIKSIARGTRIDRKTVRRYIEMAEQIGIDKRAVLTDAVVHEIAQSVQSRALPQPSDAWRNVEEHRAQIEKWIVEDLRLSRMHALLVRSGVSDVTYATLRRYAMQELGWRKKQATVRLVDPPAGQEAQIDFAEMGRVEIDGQKRRLWILIVTLGSSRYSFIWPTLSQTTHAVIEGLEAAWKFFDGMPKTLVPDNASSMIVGAHATSPRLNEVFAEYTQARGIFVDLARVRKPRDKAKVERNVTYARDGWYAGETACKSLADWRRSATSWCRDIAGARVHGTTRKVPRDSICSSKIRDARSADCTLRRAFVCRSEGASRSSHSSRARSTRCRRCISASACACASIRRRCEFIATELIKMHPRQEPGGRATDRTTTLQANRSTRFATSMR